MVEQRQEKCNLCGNDLGYTLDEEKYCLKCGYFEEPKEVQKMKEVQIKGEIKKKNKKTQYLILFQNLMKTK